MSNEKLFYSSHAKAIKMGEHHYFLVSNKLRIVIVCCHVKVPFPKQPTQHLFSLSFVLRNIES